uniref:hypothetical protein n=1 Tax=Photorhabdus sp. RM322S TaxID=3342825 RepID=UPI0036DD33A7
MNVYEPIETQHGVLEAKKCSGLTWHKCVLPIPVSFVSNIIIRFFVKTKGKQSHHYT